MDNQQKNSAEKQTLEAVTPKPPVIATIEASQRAHTEWYTAEKQRLENYELAKKTGLSTDEFSKPITQPEGAKRHEALFALSSKANTACDKAFQNGETKVFDALLAELTADMPATSEKITQADTIIENICNDRRDRNKAGLILEKNPDALHLPATQGALRTVVSELTRNVDGLLDAALALPDGPLNTNKLLEVATSETSPLEKDLKDQLRDTLDLVRGAKAQHLVDGLIDQSIMEPKAALIKENHLAIISKIIGVTLDKTSLEDALGQHRKLLADRKVTSSDYTPDLSRTNFGEALAALSQRTEDPAQKRHLEGIALGYATGIKFDPEYSKSEKAGSILMALLLDTKDPEARAYIAVEEAGKRHGDILAQQIPMIFNDVMNYSTERSMNSLFDIQNRAALDARDKRQDAEKVKAAAEKVKADELVAQAKAEADRLAAEAKAAIPIKGPATVITPPKKGFLDKLRGG